MRRRYSKKKVNEDEGTPKHHLGVRSNFKHMLKHALKHVDYDNDGDVDDDDFKKLMPDEITGNEKKDYTKIAAKKNKDELQHTRKGVAFESNTPSDREQGTKSLVKIYKKDTPNEE